MPLFKLYRHMILKETPYRMPTPPQEDPIVYLFSKLMGFFNHIVVKKPLSTTWLIGAVNSNKKRLRVCPFEQITFSFFVVSHTSVLVKATHREIFTKQ